MGKKSCVPGKRPPGLRDAVAPTPRAAGRFTDLPSRVTALLSLWAIRLKAAVNKARTEYLALALGAGLPQTAQLRSEARFAQELSPPSRYLST